MSKNNKRFVWKTNKENQGYVYDRLTQTKVAHNKKSKIDTLNKLWNTIEKLEKQNQNLIQENTLLQEDRNYLNNLLKSYKDYYGKPINKAEWYGYIKRCYK